MAIINWKSAVSGSFNTKALWSSGAVPSSADTADLIAGSSAYTVTSSQVNTISGLEVNKNATLAISAATFLVSDLVSIAGAVDVASGATFSVGNATNPLEMANLGTLALNGGTMTITNQVVLNGPGAVALAANSVINGVANSVLDNAGNVIKGVGSIGGGGSNMVFNNEALGVVDATGALLAIDTSFVQDTNAGTLEATGAGNLKIASNLVQDGKLLADGTGTVTIGGGASGNFPVLQGGGDIEALVAGAKIVLNDGSLQIGGRISTVAGSSFTVLGSSNELSASSVQNAGSLVITAGATLKANATIVNSGTIQLNGGLLQAFNGGATLDGRGKLVLSNSLANKINSDGADETLSNFGNTISGAGVIGDNFLRFVNLIGGVVNANDTLGLTLFGDTDLANEHALYNAGLIENTGAGGLKFVNTIDNAGTIEENSATSALKLVNVNDAAGGGLIEIAKGSLLLNNSVVADGSVTIAAGAVLNSGAAANQVNGLVATVNNGGVINVTNSTLEVGLHCFNSGKIVLQGSAAGATLELAAANGLYRLDGGGTLLMNDSVANSIVSNGSAQEFRNENNTIAGFGTIGDANLTLQNEKDGVIDATSATAALSISTGANQAFNAGLIEATAKGGLTVNGALLNDGVLSASAGILDVTGAATGFGIAKISGSGTVEFDSTTQGEDTYFGAGATGTTRTLRLGDSVASPFSGEIHGFAAGDRVFLSDFVFSANTSKHYAPQLGQGVLTLTSATQSTTLDFFGTYTAANFSLSLVGGGTMITFH